MTILTLNCGSSSVKYQVYNWDSHTVLGKGVIERVGQKESDMKHQTTSKGEFELKRVCPSHKEAVAWVLEILVDPSKGCLTAITEVSAVGHRVVHGGSLFTQSVLIDEETLSQFEKVSNLAPLHNPANLLGIKGAMQVLPHVPHAAIMDTAWHQTMPKHAYLYALPYSWYQDHGVRRYGFHGSSFLYTAKRAALLLGKSNSETNVIICHIGNGASICAVKGGISVDTSMGMTPLEGLVMGSRSGDIDAGIIAYIAKEKNLDANKIDMILNKESGLLGVTGRFTDRRDVEDGVASGDVQCILAQKLEVYRLKQYIGSYIATLGSKVDAIIFTAGVGEFGDIVREQALSSLEHIGIELDLEKNRVARTSNAETCISKPTSAIKVFVIPTDEELVMTEDTFALSQGSYKVHTEYQYIFESKNYINKARAEALPRDLVKKVGLAQAIVLPK